MRGLGGRPGQAAAHGDDHGPVDDGLVVFGQPLIVADGATAAGDPGQGALDDPAARQHLEGMQVIGAPDDGQGELERGLGPGDQLAGVDAVGPGKPDLGERLAQVPQQRPGRVRSCTLAAVTSTVSSRPVTSAAICRLRPCTFLPASNPRLSLATVSAALTDWESMTAAVGSGARPAAMRQARRSSSCIASVAPDFPQPSSAP